MGTQKNGLHGPVEGRIGNLVHYVLNGKNVSRLIGRSTKPSSLKQLAVRRRMKVVTEFLRSTLSYINLGFASEVAGTDKNPHNAAVSYNFTHATVGEYPEIQIEYSKVRISSGILAAPTGLTLTNQPNSIEISWDVAGLTPQGTGCDRSMVLLYFPEQDSSLIFFNDVQRYHGVFSAEIPEDCQNQRMEAYLAFSDVVTHSTSPSAWAGSIL